MGGCAATPQAEVQASPTVANDNIIGLMKQANTAYNQNQWIQAAEYYEQLIAMTPQDEYAHFRLGNIYLRQEQASKAIDHFKQSIAINNSFIEARNNLSIAYILLAEREFSVIQQLLDEQQPVNSRTGNLAQKRTLLKQLAQLPLFEANQIQ